MKGYFANNKRILFPYLQEYHSAQNQLRHAKIRDLTYQQWFFFHPTSYLYFNYLFRIMPAILASTGLLLYIKHNNFISIICAVIITYSAYKTIRFASQHSKNKDINFYDVLIRE